MIFIIKNTCHKSTESVQQINDKLSYHTARLSICAYLSVHQQDTRSLVNFEKQETLEKQSIGLNWVSKMKSKHRNTVYVQLHYRHWLGDTSTCY